MTKKVRELTDDEIAYLCESQKCDTCPYKYFQIKITRAFIANEENYSVCLLKIKRIMESEVEIDE